MQLTGRRHFDSVASPAGGGVMTPTARVVRFLRLLARTTRCSTRLMMWSANFIIIALSGLLAFLLRFDFHLTPHALRCITWAVPLWVAAKGVAFRWHELDRGWWR